MVAHGRAHVDTRGRDHSPGVPGTALAALESACEVCVAVPPHDREGAHDDCRGQGHSQDPGVGGRITNVGPTGLG